MVKKSNVVTLGAFHRLPKVADHQGESVTPIEIVGGDPVVVATLRAVIIDDAQKKIKKEAEDMARAGSMALVVNFLKNLTQHFEERMQP